MQTATIKSFDVNKIRGDFPFIENVDSKGIPLVFLDTAASAQKPKCMIDAISKIYSFEYANVHRGIYKLSEIATTKFEKVRTKTAKFINAPSENQVIFTKNATEAINLVAMSYVQELISEGDEILITEAEHHANIIPWQVVARKKGAIIKVVPVDNSGQIIIDEYEKLLSTKTVIIAFTHVSNVLGTIFPVQEMVKLAREKTNAKILIDACQSIVHFDIDVQELDCDFLVFSAHKIYGPNGVGVLYGKYELLEKMPPFQTGGSMVTDVEYHKAKFQLPPLRFEAGTPCIAEVITFGIILDYINQIDRKKANEYEDTLLEFATKEINKLKNFQIIGNKKEKVGIISIIHNTAHSSDIGFILNNYNIAIRTGHHCALPLMKRFGLSSTARASLGIYNNEDDIYRFIKALKKADKMFI